MKIEDDSTTIGVYRYDSLNRRIIKEVYDGGSPDYTRHCYFSNQWQVLEERIDSDTDPNRQFLWGIRYIDDLILRDRDTDGNGTLDERLYALQDALYNVVALAEDDGTIVERFVYAAYGENTGLDPDYTTYTGTDYQWEYRFTGRERDHESGLQLNRERYLHPILGRWLSRDPLGYKDGMNLYEYVDSNPIIIVDPDGLGAWDTFVCITAVTAASAGATVTILDGLACIVPGEGCLIGDVFQCIALFPAFAGTVFAIDTALDKCQKAQNWEAVRNLQRLKAEVEEVEDKVRSALDSIGLG